MHVLFTLVSYLVLRRPTPNAVCLVFTNVKPLALDLPKLIIQHESFYAQNDLLQILSNMHHHNFLPMIISEQNILESMLFPVHVLL